MPNKRKKIFPLCVCVTEFQRLPGFGGEVGQGPIIQYGVPVCRDCGGLGHQPDNNRFYGLVAEISTLCEIYYPSILMTSARVPFIDHPSGVRLGLLKKIEGSILKLRKQFGALPESLAEQVANGMLDGPVQILVQLRQMALEAIAQGKALDPKLYLEFNSHAQHGRYHKAEKLLLNAYAQAKDGKKRALVARYLGDLYCWFWLRYDQAEKWYKEVLQFDPADIQAQLDLGVFYVCKLAHCPSQLLQLRQQAIFYLESAAQAFPTARALLAGFGYPAVRFHRSGGSPPTQTPTGMVDPEQTISNFERAARGKPSKITYKN